MPNLDCGKLMEVDKGSRPKGRDPDNVSWDE